MRNSPPAQRAKIAWYQEDEDQSCKIPDVKTLNMDGTKQRRFLREEGSIRMSGITELGDKVVFKTFMFFREEGGFHMSVHVCTYI